MSATIDTQAALTEDPVSHAAAQLMGSLLLFTKTFYKIRTGREFKLSNPTSRESHYVTICKALTKVQRGEIKRLLINVPPRYGKTELLIHFVSWCLAQFHDANFIYVSYAKALASKQTSIIRQIVTNPEFRSLFGVSLSDSTAAKDNFETTEGGSVYGVGSGGSITGRGAGITGVDRFGGCIIIDDIIKPDDALSDTIREGCNDWYFNTLLSRLNNGDSTPIIYLGQRVGEGDLADKLKAGFDGHEWHQVILPALDNNDHALFPELHSTDYLLKLKESSPYVFAAQYQQDPQPAGGGIFKQKWFVELDETPQILSTFIIGDCAETEKQWNDPTVFSFFGIYKLENQGIELDEYGIHWLGCRQIWVEPKDLESEFLSFWGESNLFHVKPKRGWIEKKSTGTTLYSVMSDKIRGFTVDALDPGKMSKVARFLRAQPYVASKQISISSNAKHKKMCVEHMGKISANGSHAHDDIADTLEMAIRVVFIEKLINIDANQDDMYMKQQYQQAYQAYKPVVF